MEDNEKLPWYRDSQIEPPFRLTTCFKVGRACSISCHVLRRCLTDSGLQNLRGLEYRFVSLFPWNLTTVPDSHLGDDWVRFIETYAGSVVIGSTEELYLVRALRPSGKQKQQIRLDPVSLRCFSWRSDAGLKGYGQGVSPITAVAWALSRSSPLDPLLVIAMSSTLCVYSVGRGEAVGFMRGHGGVCLWVPSRTLFSDLRTVNFLRRRSPTGAFICLHHLLRPNSESLRS
jgi:hypothetical protein